MPYASANHLVSWQCETATVGLGARTLHFSAIGFDVAYQEVLATVCAGGTLVVPSDEDRNDFSRLLALIASEEVERLFLPFAALAAVAELADSPLPSLREIVTAGEQLQVTTALKRLLALAGAPVLKNQYGPTETHVVTEHRVDVETDGPLPPIGRAIPDMDVMVLDTEMRPCPTGVAGEIAVTGPQVALGYLGRPSETAARFKLGPDPRYRLYLTGDRGRVRSDGALEFLGRTDTQIKVRGYRVELGEIEAMFREHPAVRETAVARRGDSSHLTAYYVGATVSSEEFRKYLLARLPEYMVPRDFVQLDVLPRGQTGKIDRKRLSELEPPRPTEMETETNDSVATSMAAIWQELLDTDLVLTHDSDFFERGGHSLLAVACVAAIQREFGVRLTMRQFFENPTLGAVSNFVRARGAGPV